MSKRRKRTYYHCSAKFHGDVWDVPRRAPVLIGEDEPDTPRLCVCHTIGACFSARLFNHGGSVYVYRNEKPRAANRPRDVHDAILTRERWFVPPVRMVLDSVIPGPVVWEVMAPTVMRLSNKQGPDYSPRKPLSMRERIAFYARSLPILRGAGVHVPRWEMEAITQLHANLNLANLETQVV